MELSTCERAYLAFEAFLATYLTDDDLPRIETPVEEIFEEMRSSGNKHLEYFLCWRDAVFLGDLALVAAALPTGLPATLAFAMALRRDDATRVMWNPFALDAFVQAATKQGCIGSLALVIEHAHNELYDDRYVSSIRATKHPAVMREYLSHAIDASLTLHEILGPDTYTDMEANVVHVLLAHPRTSDEVILYYAQTFSDNIAIGLCEAARRGLCKNTTFTCKWSRSLAGVFVHHWMEGNTDANPLPLLLEALLICRTPYFTLIKNTIQRETLITTVLTVSVPASTYGELLRVLVRAGETFRELYNLYTIRKIQDLAHIRERTKAIPTDMLRLSDAVARVAADKIWTDAERTEVLAYIAAHRAT
jgi:hypothetical protein